MKKIIIFLASFFIFNMNCFALINDDDIEIYINKDGSALISENITMNGVRKLKYDNMSISNIKLDDESTDNYEISINDNVKISYKIENFVTKYKDTVGINFKINDSISRINIKINGDYKFSENNTALYLIGNDSNVLFEDGTIYINDENLKKIVLLTSFAGLEFKSYNKSNDTILTVYNSYLKNKFKLFESKIVYIILIIMIIIILLIILIRFISYKNHRIKVIGHIKDEEEIEYYEDIPCNGDYYLMYFLLNYFKLINNKSNLIGMIIFKFILNEKITVEDDKYYLKNNLKFDNNLDNELYDILISASNGKMMFTKKTLKTYILNNKDRILRWYKKVYIYGLSCLPKTGKKYSIDGVLINEVNNLQGLKKYIMFFNQVPRSKKLTVKTYKSILIISILFGIDKSYAKEVLRKNNDNIYAKYLLNYDKKLYNYIYDNIKDVK